MQLLLQAKWVANVSACVVSSAAVSRVYVPRKRKRKSRRGTLKWAKQMSTTSSEALNPEQ